VERFCEGPWVSLIPGVGKSRPRRGNQWRINFLCPPRRLKELTGRGLYGVIAGTPALARPRRPYGQMQRGKSRPDVSFITLIGGAQHPVNSDKLTLRRTPKMMEFVPRERDRSARP
jgi:hypothetical protein